MNYTWVSCAPIECAFAYFEVAIASYLCNNHKFTIGNSSKLRTTYIAKLGLSLHTGSDRTVKTMPC